MSASNGSSNGKAEKIETKLVAVHVTPEVALKLRLKAIKDGERGAGTVAAKILTESVKNFAVPAELAA